MKGMKRIFALVLSFVMIFTAMPVIGNAEENKLADVKIVLDNSDSDKGTLTMSTDKPYVAEGVIITATAKEGYRVIDIVPDKEIYVMNGFKYTQKGNNGEAVFIAYDYKDTFTFKAVYEDIRTTKVAIYDYNHDHGEVKLSKRDVPFGEELTIKTFPSEGYGTEYIKFNGEIYNEETITVKNTGWGDRQTVYVNFKPSSKVSTGLMFLDESEYEISGINCGTVTVNKSVLKTNEELNIKCEPKDGYEYAHMEIKTIVDGKLKTIKYCYEKEFNFKSAEIDQEVKVVGYFRKCSKHKVTYEINYDNAATVHVRKESTGLYSATAIHVNSANPGEEVRFEILPNPGYKFEYITLDYGYGIQNRTTTNFKMPDKDVHVKITFEIERYDAHYYINDDNGKTSINLIGITGKNSYEFGEEVNLTVENPDTDSKYRYEGLYVYCDNKLIASTKDSKIKFNMPSGNIDVYARFHKRGVQTLGFYVNEGYGRMEFEGYRLTEDNRLTQASEDSVIKCKVIPNEGYRLKKAEIKYSTVLQETKTELEFSFIMPNETAIVSLYFEKIPTYTVKFNKNGGDGTMAPIENVKEGTVIKVPECKFTRGDFNFVGWTINNEEVKINEITVNSDIELYAKWNLPSYTITISCNEGGTIILGAWELSKNVYEAYKGDDVMMEVSPEKGYRVVPGSLRFEPKEADGGDDLQFKMPDYNVTIYCEFEKNCEHNNKTKIPGKPATCTEDGYTDGLKCAGCGKVLEEQTTIPKLDHKWDEGEVTIPNDYDHPGIKTFHCLNEGCTETKTQFIPKLVCMHVITKIVPAQPATCTEDGYSDIVCDICKKVFNKVTIPAIGHKWDEGKVTKNPTNDENGERLYTCTNDGCMETKTEIIPMLVCEHTNTEVIPGKAPTCTEEGLTDGLKCARCEKVLEEQTTIPKLDHKWDEGKVIKPATTTEKGIKEYKCTNDGCTETKTEDIPKLGGGSSGGGSGSGSGSGGSGSGSTLKDDKLPQAINKEITLHLDSNKISILGEEIENDVMPIVRNNRTMLPIRVIAETLGAKVEWNEKEPTIVKITKGDKVIIITLGSNIAKVNDKEYELEQEAFAENNRTYMPVRFIAENLDAVVEWNEKNPSEVKIYEK